MNNEKENNSEIGDHAYMAPYVERVQFQVEGQLKGSHRVMDDGQGGMAMDAWGKFRNTNIDTWNDQ